MELKKKKYKKSEVEILINALKTEFENTYLEYKNKIRDLVKENNDLKSQLDCYKDKESLITSTLFRAESISKDFEDKAKIQYELEIERIKRFAEKWNGYFTELKEKYPLYPITRKALDVKEQLEELVCDGVEPKDAIEKLDKMIDDNKDEFDPKSKIKDYIAATSDNGFNMEEVLNPGALKLEDLCKELGLIEENE